MRQIYMGKNVAKNVAFHFSPFSYPLRWAERAEDVPWWDSLRGFPVQMSFTGMNTKESPDHRGLGALVLGEGWEPLGDDKLPVNIYPCLVRAALESLPPAPVGGDDLLNGLARIGKMKGNRLRNQVLELARRYGFPTVPFANSLREWESAGWEVKTYMEALRTLSEDGGRLDHLRESEAGMIRTPARESGTEQEFRQKVADFLLSLVTSDEWMPWRSHPDTMMHGGQGRTPLFAAVADVEHGRVSFVVRAGSLTYARYLLAQRFLERTTTHTCEICGAYFFGNGGAKTCSPGCRSKKSRKAGSS